MITSYRGRDYTPIGLELEPEDRERYEAIRAERLEAGGPAATSLSARQHRKAAGRHPGEPPATPEPSDRPRGILVLGEVGRREVADE